MPKDIWGSTSGKATLIPTEMTTARRVDNMKDIERSFFVDFMLKNKLFQLYDMIIAEKNDNYLSKICKKSKM